MPSEFTMHSQQKRTTTQRNNTCSDYKQPTKLSICFKLGEHSSFSQSVRVFKQKQNTVLYNEMYLHINVYVHVFSDPKELQSWIDTINFVCASFSSQPLEGAVGSQKKFQRPLLPCSHTKLNLVCHYDFYTYYIAIT